MMAEYIEREAPTCKDCLHWVACKMMLETSGYVLSENYIPNASRCDTFTPASDVVEVVHGRNLKDDTPSLFECSVCHWCSYDTICGDTEDYNYCPNCGARMGGGKDAH